MERRPRCVLCGAALADERWRPFCSRRCQQLDLARWLDGTYRIAGDPAPSDPAPDREEPPGEG